jgi:ribonuclease HI
MINSYVLTITLRIDLSKKQVREVKMPKHLKDCGLWSLMDPIRVLARVGIVLTTPSHETFYYSYRLEYHCTNNITEYKALILGLNLAIDKGVTHLRVIGDLDLIVSQVLLDFVAKNEKLKKYHDFARSIAKSFEMVTIKVVPREENHVADALVVSASTLQPCDGPLQNLCKMEVLFRPSIHDKLEHWQVFEDDD